MIYNFWVFMSPAFRTELNAAIEPAWIDDGGAGLQGTTVAATSYPLVNYTVENLKKLFLSQTEVHPNVFSLYTETSQLGSITNIREVFQLWEERYSGDFAPVGAWDYDGQPIGGVGSPWFQTPDEYKEDKNLRGRQEPRQFV